MSSLSQKASKQTAHSRKMLDPGVVVDIVAGCCGVVGSAESIVSSLSLSSPCGIVVVEIETMLLSKGGSTDEALGSAASFLLAMDSLNFWKKP